MGRRADMGGEEMSIEKQLEKALSKLEKFTLWKIDGGYQANAMREGSSGWNVRMKEKPLDAVKAVLGLEDTGRDVTPRGKPARTLIPAPAKKKRKKDDDFSDLA